MSAGDRDTLARILAEHTYLLPVDRAHVADVIASSDWLREQRAEAWDEGATHADREWQNSEYNNDGSTPGYEYWDTDLSANPYRRTTEDTGLSSDPETI